MFKQRDSGTIIAAILILGSITLTCVGMIVDVFQGKPVQWQPKAKAGSLTLTQAPTPILQWSGGITLRDIKVVDGDTIHADIILAYGVVLEDQTIRAIDYDAWESRKIRRSVGKISDDEIAKGQKAKAALQVLIDQTDITLEAPTDPKRYRDNYGRLLGKLYTDGHSIGQWMQKNGHCRAEPLTLEPETDE